MPPTNEPIRLDASELYTPQVDAYLEEQAVLRRPIPEAEPQPLLLRIFYASYFYLRVYPGSSS